VLTDHAALTLTGVLVLFAFGGASLLVASVLLVRLALGTREPDEPPVESLHRPWMDEGFAELERFADAKELPQPDGIIGRPSGISEPERVVIVEPNTNTEREGSE
jgi:hypothetical protein